MPNQRYPNPTTEEEMRPLLVEVSAAAEWERQWQVTADEFKKTIICSIL